MKKIKEAFQKFIEYLKDDKNKEKIGFILIIFSIISFIFWNLVYSLIIFLFNSAILGIGLYLFIRYDNKIKK